MIMVLAMLWSTQGDQFGTIFEAINKIPMTFAPAVTTVFVLGMLWKRGTRQAAMATLYVGLDHRHHLFPARPAGHRRWMVARAAEARRISAGLVTDPAQGLGIPFMLVGPMLAVLCVVIYVVTSLLTPADGSGVKSPKSAGTIRWHFCAAASRALRIRAWWLCGCSVRWRCCTLFCANRGRREKNMRQAVMTQPGVIEHRQAPPPQPGPGEVLLRVRCIGVCGSDIHVWHGKHPFTTYPVVQGHEFSAVVEAVGEGVDSVRAGQRATAAPQVVCGRCKPCLRGDYHICDSLKVRGFQSPRLRARPVPHRGLPGGALPGFGGIRRRRHDGAGRGGGARHRSRRRPGRPERPGSR